MEGRNIEDVVEYERGKDRLKGWTCRQTDRQTGSVVVGQVTVTVGLSPGHVSESR